MVNDVKERLVEYFSNKKVIVAFSGGLDSTVLLHLVKEKAKKYVAVLISSPLLQKQEIKNAKEYLHCNSFNYLILNANPLENDDVVRNDKDRCYYCKKLLFSTISNSFKDSDYDFIVEGSNTSDLGDYRPGLKALKELKVTSPYLELGVSKTEIREIARMYNLSIADAPPSTCLATRVTYDMPLSAEILSTIDEIEHQIKRELEINLIRARVHSSLIRIEVRETDFYLFLDEEKRKRVIEIIQTKGFKYISLDLIGYKQGSMNRILGE